MSKKEEIERQRAIAEIEAKFSEPEYKGERVFALIGIVCSGIIVAQAIMQLYNIIIGFTVGGQSFSDGVTRFVNATNNPITVFAPFFWTFSTM